MIDEHKETQIALEQEIEDSNHEKAGEKNKFNQANDQLSEQLEENIVQHEIL